MAPSPRELHLQREIECLFKKKMKLQSLNPTLARPVGGNLIAVNPFNNQPVWIVPKPQHSAIRNSIRDYPNSVIKHMLLLSG
jgi:hypothetical protein